MILSKQGSELIKKYEGFRNHPYLDAVGVPTIGYGNTYYSDGTAVTMSDEPLTREQANELFRDVVSGFEDAVNSHVKVCLYQCQFDALVSFAYNVGVGAFRSSTLLKRINANPNDPDIARQFKRWDKADGKVLKGLTKRRNEEAYLYFQCNK